MYNITDYHAKYFAYQLTKRCPSDTPEKLSATLANAQVDLNPHQIESALFAFKSPLSKGAILADEVGLGKTIEAGILLSQHWAERKRKLLIIAPSNLRKQWSQELQEKFFIPSSILEAKSFNYFIKQGRENPFDQKDVVICSYHFARNKQEFLNKAHWDLVVMDEAHKLRNVYRTDNKIGKAIKEALESAKKILLTATPLQNSLLELYGLVSIIDEHIFGDFKSYKSQFTRLENDEQNFEDLKERLKPICKRNLRRHVQEYINYKNRIPITVEFVPTEEEQTLYDMVSEYLRKENLQALPKAQRHLMILILRKLLASSSFAITRTLAGLAKKLKKKLKDSNIIESYEDIAKDFSAYEELTEEWEEEEEKEVLTQADARAIENEIKELEAFRDLSESIVHNAKGEKLITALKMGFDKARELGGQEKALIFTESTRTQEYLNRVLEEIPEYAGKVVLFNGSNNDTKSKEIFSIWSQKYKGTDMISGSKSADMRAAIVDYFRNQAKIMIATEAGAEGINLQFCSLVINYDLPWNPQRIEQRIGRCHRYGQEYDVVVVNFVNKSNEADQRVFELLRDKFQLFSGVFGASDEVLGVIESGVDFEKRIAQIYQACRTKGEIKESFDKLQAEMEQAIIVNMKSTREKLFDHFDEEVLEKLRVTRHNSREYLDRYEQWLWNIAEFGLGDVAEFDPQKVFFTLNSNPFPSSKIALGRYKMGKGISDAHIFRLGHPLAQALIDKAKALDTSTRFLVFDYSGSPNKITILEKFIGKTGWLSVSYATVSALEEEDHIIHSGIMDGEVELDDEQCMRLFSLPVSQMETVEKSKAPAKLGHIFGRKKTVILEDIASRNAIFFEEEMDKLDKWAEDKRNALKLNLKELDALIKDKKREARTARNLPDKLSAQKSIREIEKKRDAAWHEYDEAGRDIEKQKDGIIDLVEKKLDQKVRLNDLFTIKWKIV